MLQPSATDKRLRVDRAETAIAMIWFSLVILNEVKDLCQ